MCLLVAPQPLVFPFVVLFAPWKLWWRLTYRLAYPLMLLSPQRILSRCRQLPIQSTFYSHIVLVISRPPLISIIHFYIISQLINQVSFLTWRSWFLPNQTESVEQFTIYFPLSFVLAFVGQFRTILSTWRGRVLFRGSWERYRATFTAAIVNISFVGLYVWRRSSWVYFW